MSLVRAQLVARPIHGFFAVAFLFTWSLLPWAATSVAVGLLALWGPAVAALVVASAGDARLRHDFRARVTRWRLPLRWYLLALLAPLPVSALRSGLELALGADGPMAPQPVSALSMVVFVLVAGEELGWRGLALPLLLERFGPWTASAALGVVWALWHLPLFYMPGMPQFGTPFPAFVAYTTGLSLLLTLLALRTGGSVLVATLFHGAVNTFGLVTAATDATLRGWTNAVSYGAVAVVLGVATWGRRSTPRPRLEPAP